MSAPRPRVVDHLRVAGLLVRTLLGVVPIVLWILAAAILKPLVRRAYRRRLEGPGRPPAVLEPPAAGAWAGRTVFVVAGETSGDRLAAPVVRALRRACPGLTVRGYGGGALAAAGARLDEDIVAHAVVGVVAVIRSLGTWWRLCAETLARLREEPPDLFLTVDFPGLNVRLARWARGRGIPTVHLVAPAVWAYLPWRGFRWRGAADRVLALYRFEVRLLERMLPGTLFVGHPLFEAPLPPPRTGTSWPGDGPCRVELLPGSRGREIDAHAALLLEAAADVEAALPAASFHVSLAEASDVVRFEAAARRARRRPTRLTVSPGTSPPDVPLLGALAASGTVTAELGAALVPLTVFYRVSPVARLGALCVLTAPYFALVNLVAGRRVAPERLLLRARGEAVARDFLAVAGTRAAWERARRDLEGVRAALEVPDVATRVAYAVLGASTRPVGQSAREASPAGGPS